MQLIREHVVTEAQHFLPVPISNLPEPYPLSNSYSPRPCTRLRTVLSNSNSRFPCKRAPQFELELVAASDGVLEAAKLLGHSNTATTTKHYARPIAGRDFKVANNLDQQFNAVGNEGRAAS